MAYQNSQELDSGICSGLSGSQHSPMQISPDTVDQNEPDSKICDGASDITHSPMQISDNSEEGGNEELLSRIDTLERILKEKDETEKKYKEEGYRLIAMLETMIDEKKQLTSKIGKSDKEKQKQKKEIDRLKRVLGVFMKSSPASLRANYFLLNWAVHDFKVGKEEAHRLLQKLYEDASPNLPAFQPLGDLEAFHHKLSSCFDDDAPPCFVNTLCVFYKLTCPEIPFFFYNYDPTIHTVVGEQFVKRHFFIVLTLDFDQRKEIPELCEKRYVLCYYVIRDTGHMCVVSKEELDAIKSDNHVGFKFSDQVLQKDIERNAITRFIICLPRGDMSSIDGYYKMAEVTTLQQLHGLQLNEPACEVYFNNGMTDVSFEWTKKPQEQQYSTTSPHFHQNLNLDICGEVRLAKGKPPFLVL